MPAAAVPALRRLITAQAGSMTDAAQLLSALAGLARLLPDGPRLLGVGWATVDLDRTLAGIARPEGSFGPLVADDVLGARGRTIDVGAIALAILEPSTEGRLAAALARRGEGIACLYLAGVEAAGGSRRTAIGRPGRALPHDRPFGPFLILVDPAP